MKHIHVPKINDGDSFIDDLDLLTILNDIEADKKIPEGCERTCGNTACDRECAVRLVVDSKEHKL